MIGTSKQVQEYVEWKKWIFEVKQKRDSTLRSIAQNKYYFWVVIRIISDFHGQTPVETHELIKLMFKIETTTDLSTKDFMFLIDSIRDIWNTKFWVYIPAPNEVEELQALEKYFYDIEIETQKKLSNHQVKEF